MSNSVLEGIIKGIVAQDTIKRATQARPLVVPFLFGVFMVLKIKNKHGDKAVWVDNEYAYLFSKYSWYIGLNGYVISEKSCGNGKVKTLRLHRLIALPPDGFVVDHKNGDKLDNRRSNLRIVLQSQNAMNRKISNNNTTGYKSVTIKGKKFCARISIGRYRKYLGTFDTALQAFEAYCDASKKYHGEFGRFE